MWGLTQRNEDGLEGGGVLRRSIGRRKGACMPRHGWSPGGIEMEGGEAVAGCYRAGDEPGETVVGDKENGNSLPES